jgi:hypothetical protein
MSCLPSSFQIASFPKTTAEFIPLPVNWTLPAAETLVSAVWTISPFDVTDATQLILGTGGYAPTLAARRTVVWVSSGTPNVNYQVIGTLTTSTGRVFQRFISVCVSQINES